MANPKAQTQDQTAQDGEHAGGALTKVEQYTKAITGSLADPKEANKRLEWAAKAFHLISPSAQVGTLPEGCEIVTSAVMVVAGSDTYPIQGSSNLGLGKTALDRIAAGLGITWDPTQSHRLDDASDSRYCRWRAVGHYRAFDGQIMTIAAEKEVDLRDGSPQIAGWSEKRLAQAREHVQSNCETKARLRAIRTLGVKTSYPPDELSKPFVCARVMFTGRTRDPELRREFARMNAEAFLGGVTSLYGKGATDRQALPSAATGTPPPPVGSLPAHDDDLPPPPVDVTPAPAPASPPPPPAPPSTPKAGLRLPKKGGGGPLLTEAKDDDLAYWQRRLAEKLEEEPEGRYAAGDRELLEGIRAELLRRKGGAQTSFDGGF